MFFIKNLETSRLTFRSWRKSDKGFTLFLWGDRENRKYMSDSVRENMDETYFKCVGKMKDNPGRYYLLAKRKADAMPIGTRYIFPEDGNYGIRYCVAKEHWREGLGAEMVDAILRWMKTRGGKSVTGEAADGSLPLIAFLRKFEFTEDRRTRYKK